MTDHARNQHGGRDDGPAQQLVQIFLPLRDNQGQDFPQSEFELVRKELTNRFGGVTAFLRAPAVGAWEDDEGKVQRDEVVLLEVMTDELDRKWWKNFRGALEARFRQEEILIRATAVEKL